MIAFLLLNGGAACAAVLVALATHGGAGAGAFALAALCTYLVAIHTIVLVGGVLGHLTVGGAGVLVVAFVLVAAWLTRRSRGAVDIVPSRVRAGAAEIFSALAVIAAGGVWAWPHLVDATRLWIWDDYTYHMIYPALWVRDHAIAVPAPEHSFTMQAWYPLSASAVAAWFMLPFSTARAELLAWVSLTGPLYAAIAVASMAALFAKLQCRPWAWAPAAAIFFTSERVAMMASNFSDADLALATALFAALVFAVPRGGDDRSAVAEAWYAALLSGIALGIKVSAAVPALIVAAMCVVRAVLVEPERRPRAVVRTALVFAVAWLATGGYWYARNLMIVGNPVYPARFLIWPGATFPETSLVEYARRWGVARAISDALAVYLNWPHRHGALAAIGLVALVVWLAWRRGRMTRPRAFFAIGGTVLAVAIVALLPPTPYSAGNAMTFRSGFVHWDSMRYVGVVAILGWTALAFAIDATLGRAAGVAGALVTAVALLGSPSPTLRSPVALCGLALAAIMVARLAPSRAGTASPRRLAVSAVAVGLALAVLIGSRHVDKAGATGAWIQGERFFGGLARALDDAPPGTRVAIFGDQSVFLTAGGRNDLDPVRVDRDGRPATAPIGDAMEPGELTIDSRAFVENLRATGVGRVVVVRLPHPGRSGERPSQERALEHAVGARLLWRGEAVTVWAIDGPR